MSLHKHVGSAWTGKTRTLCKWYVRTEPKLKFIVIKRPYTDEWSECAHTSTGISFCRRRKNDIRL